MERLMSQSAKSAEPVESVESAAPAEPVEPAQWVIYMTECAADPGQARIFVYGQGGGPVARLESARVFGSRGDAEAWIRRWLYSDERKWGGYSLTAVPLRGPAIPPLPGELTTAK
jgi:hypothetical protein